MEKQRLLYQQARLHNRGAAEMVLQMISACKGAFPRALPPAHHLPGTPRHTLPPCSPVPHTIPCTSPPPFQFLPLPPSRHTVPPPFSHIPGGGRWLVGGEHGSQTEPAVSCPTPTPSRRDGRHGVLHLEAGHLHPQWRQCGRAAGNRRRDLGGGQEGWRLPCDSHFPCPSRLLCRKCWII